MQYSGGMLYKNNRPITKSKRVYKNIWVDGKCYTLHRLIFFYHHKYFPKVVDHIDRDPTNNNIENLRGGDHKLNSLNHKKVISAKGWWMCKRTNKYVATINIASKNKVLGYFSKKEDAEKAYKIALEEKWKTTTLNN